MIGQHQAKEQIELFRSGIPPALTIVAGGRASGKKEFTRYMANHFKMQSAIIGNKVADIREMIEFSSTTSQPRFYIIEKGDSMSNGAKNSLLKITEEPPVNCHIIMLISNESNTLPTLTSRGQLIKLTPYTVNEKMEFIENSRFKVSDTEAEFLCKICDNLGQIYEVLLFGHEQVIKDVKFTVENMFDVSPSNVLNISKFIALKKSDTDKIPPALFVRCVNTYLSNDIVKLSSQPFQFVERVCKVIAANGEALRQLNKVGASNQLIIMDWLRRVGE